MDLNSNRSLVQCFTHFFTILFLGLLPLLNGNLILETIISSSSKSSNAFIASFLLPSWNFSLSHSKSVIYAVYFLYRTAFLSSRISLTFCSVGISMYLILMFNIFFNTFLQISLSLITYAKRKSWS